MAPKAVLRPFQMQRPLGLVGRDAHGAGTVRPADLARPGSTPASTPAGQAVDLDDQHGGGVGREPGVDVGLDGSR